MSIKLIFFLSTPDNLYYLMDIKIETRRVRSYLSDAGWWSHIYCYESLSRCSDSGSGCLLDEDINPKIIFAEQNFSMRNSKINLCDKLREYFIIYLFTNYSKLRNKLRCGIKIWSQNQYGLQSRTSCNYTGIYLFTKKNEKKKYLTESPIISDPKPSLTLFESLSGTIQYYDCIELYRRKYAQVIISITKIHSFGGNKAMRITFVSAELQFTSSRAFFFPQNGYNIITLPSLD